MPLWRMAGERRGGEEEAQGEGALGKRSPGKEGLGGGPVRSTSLAFLSSMQCSLLVLEADSSASCTACCCGAGSAASSSAPGLSSWPIQSPIADSSAAAVGCAGPKLPRAPTLQLDSLGLARTDLLHFSTFDSGQILSANLVNLCVTRCILCIVLNICKGNRFNVDTNGHFFGKINGKVIDK